MHPMSNMLTLNYRKSQKNGTRRKIEMSNMLIEKERERKEEKMRILRKNSVCCNEEIMQPMNKLFIVF
jgi:hypothetical protein